MSEDRYRKLKEMEYVPGVGEILALGVYHGFQYAVLNIEGRHPCGYVNISGHVQDLEDSESEWKFARFNKIECHGGVSYAEPDLYPFYDGGFWIGWDYSHFGDFDSRISGNEGMKYSTDRVASECRDVISQIEGLLYERKTEKDVESVTISRHDFDVMMDALCDAWMHRAAQCHNIEGRDIPKELHEDWSNDFERWFDLYNRLRGEMS